MKDKTLLGIIASPRHMGNCELFVKELFAQLPAGWRLRLIRLPDLDIRPCTGCYRCLFGEMRCHLPDDFNLALDALAAADACVVAAPAYVLGANASLKRFQDRALSFYGQLDSLWGKPAVGIAIAGIEGMEGHAKLAVESFIRQSKMHLRGSEVVYGALPGEIFILGDGLNTAGKLAARLLDANRCSADEDGENAVPLCPTCGGDTFRFLPGERVRCMLCSSAGLIEWQEHGFRITASLGQQQFPATYESAKQHAQWLRSMKETFLARRAKLKPVTSEYMDVGEWLRPARLMKDEGARDTPPRPTSGVAEVKL